MAKKSNGIAGMDFTQIMQQQAFQSVNEPVYCRFCGRDVKVPSKKSAGGSNGSWRRNLDWEIENHSHTSCANQARGRR